MFSSLMTGGEIHPTWRYRANGTIWRVVPTDSGKFVGEDRNVEQKHASFFCVSQSSGEVLWDSVEFAERWWISIEAVHRDVVLLHSFAKPDLPEHKGVFGVDLLTGTKLWTNDDCKFLVAVDDLVFVSKETLEGCTILELDYRTGAILRSWGNNAQVVKDAKNRAASGVSANLEFPVSLERLHNGETEGATIVRRHCANKVIVGDIEVLSHDSAIVVNYHERAGSQKDPGVSLKNVLTILERESGNVLFHDTLNENVQAFVPESFFVRDNTLYYIKNHNTLTAVTIAASEQD